MEIYISVSVTMSISISVTMSILYIERISIYRYIYRYIERALTVINALEPVSSIINHFTNQLSGGELILSGYMFLICNLGVLDKNCNPVRIGLSSEPNGKLLSDLSSQYNPGLI